MAIADNYLKRVSQALLEQIDARQNVCMLLDEAQGAAEVAGVYRFPGIQALTVAASGASAGASQAVTDDSLQFSADKDPAVQVDLPVVDIANIAGWAEGLGRRAAQTLRNQMDALFLEELGVVTSASLDKSYSVTGSGTAGVLQRADWDSALTKLGDQPGADESRFLWIVDGKGLGSIRSIAATDWVPAAAGSVVPGSLGLPMIGSLHGIPVVPVGRAIKRQHSVETTAVSVTSNVATATVGAGHGLHVGELITTAGHTANATTPVQITAVTGTTVVYPLTASNGALADGEGTITSQCSRNLLIDMEFCRAAVNLMPRVAIKTKEQSTTRILEVTTVFGFGAIAGRAISVLTPL